jgi:chromosome segregation ATPase
MSETEVAIRDNQLEGYSGEIKDLLDNIDTSKTREKDLDLLDTKLKDFETALDTMHLDLKGLDLTVKKTYLKKYKAHKNNKKEWETKLEFVRKNSTRSELMAGHTAEASGADMHSAEAGMAHASAVQADTKSSLDRALGVVADARELGAATAQKLENQNKQVANMIDELASIDSTLERANKTMRRIARKIGTDKCLWVVIFLVVAAIIGIIVYKNTSAGKDANVSAPSINTNV